MSERIVVCLGYPTLQAPEHLERVRAVDSRVEAVTLPVDPDAEWITIPPAEPNEEPPPWALGCAPARRKALAEAHVLLALHTPADLPRQAPNLRWVQCAKRC